VETAAQVHRYVGGVLVTPMTLLRRDYLREISAASLAMA
jgi:hypothetical protein